MGKIKTSASFYRRGIPDQNKKFGYAMQTNWPIIQPMGLYIDSENRNAPSLELTPPRNVKGVGGNTQITLSWLPPLSNGGGSITDYEIKSVVPSGIILNTSSTSIIITGLTNGTAYTFIVKATNSKGKTSSPSKVSPPITPATIPDPPTSVVGTRGNQEVSLTWSAPLSNGGSAITSYTATSNPGGFTATSATTNVTITGLTNGTPYTFTVIATNSKGNSVPSLASSAVTPASVPSPPINLVGIRGNMQVDITWNTPVSDGGSTIISYTATRTPPDPGVSQSTIPPITNTTFVGLTNGTLYTFSVVATNDVGDSIPSSVEVTPATIPDPPTSVIGTRGNTQVGLTWTDPVSDGGSTITSYTATSSPGGFTATSSTKPLIVSGLTNGTPYTFTVVATNAVGSSVPSVASSAVTPATIPGPPTNVVASNGAISGSANISWTAPLSNGGDAIISYTATSSPGNITASVNVPATNVTISGLTNGTPYTFSVIATNSVGNSVASSASNSVTPTALPAASVWFDASDPSKVTLVSGGVDSLTDLTANGYNGQYNSTFVPSKTYIRPTYNVSQINGLNTFRIENTGDIFNDVQMISVPGYNFNDTFISYAIVIRYISGTSGIICTDTAGLFGRGFGSNNGTLQTISYNAFTTWNGTPSPNITIPVNTPSILVASISAGNWIFSLNGTQNTLALTQAKTPDNTQGLNIGCWNPLNAADIVFDCGEILAYTSFLTSPEIVAVEGYLATKWGLTSSLPPSHPYYSA